MKKYIIALFLMFWSVSLTTLVGAAGHIARSPQITELYPTPRQSSIKFQSQPQMQFIEIYNAENQLFDITDYKLQIGSTIKHYYVFPKGTLLKARSYTAFYSNKTHLTLDSKGDQAVLLNPRGKTVSQSAVYQNARIGRSWSKGAKGWFWAKPTPGLPNSYLYLP